MAEVSRINVSYDPGESNQPDSCQVSLQYKSGSIQGGLGVRVQLPEGTIVGDIKKAQNLAHHAAADIFDAAANALLSAGE